MAQNISEGQQYIGVDYTIESLEYNTFEDCTFESCLFSKADLRDIKFSDCTFIECDLSMANLNNTGIRSCKFKNCKMMGLLFFECSTLLFSLKANDCNLSHSSFQGMKLLKPEFTSCLFEEVDFSNAFLEGSKFDECKFPRAIFDNTSLKKVDLSSCIDFDIDPSKNEIYKATFSKDNLQGLLCKYDIQIKAY